MLPGWAHGLAVGTWRPFEPIAVAATHHLRALNPQARLEVFGQELNAETYTVCRSDMMLKGQDASHIAYGNSFSEDHHEGE